MSVMKDGARGAVGSRKQRLRNLLVIGEVALAMTLLISAGLMMKSFIRVRQINTGFNADHLMTAGITLPETQYSEPAQRNNFYRQLLHRLTATPGVESAALTSSLPLDESVSSAGLFVEGRPVPKDLSQIPVTLLCAVSPDYFLTMGVRLIRGRDFNDTDVEGKKKVVIVDETIARRLFADEDPIGRRVHLGGSKSGEWETIVGVVSSVRHFGLKGDVRMQTYRPYQPASSDSLAMTIVARGAGDTASLTSAMRNEVAALDKDLTLYAARPMAKVVEDAMWDDKIFGILFGLFAALALCLAAVGIYGVISFSVAQRTREIGLRVALGAQTGDVMRMIIRQGLTLAGLGAAVGLGGGALAALMIKSLLFNVSATDPAIFALLPLSLLAVALAACWIPARRAAKVDPMVALRCD